MDVLTRKEARKFRLHKYYTGKMCKRGHKTLRYTRTSACVACIAAYARNSRTAGFELLVWLEDVEDINAAKNYVSSLNVARKLQKVVDGL